MTSRLSEPYLLNKLRVAKRCWCAVALAGVIVALPGEAEVAEPEAGRACQTAVVEGEVKFGDSFTQKIGGNLAVWFQPIHSGWILRVIPAAGPKGEHDYAELATPPYHSVSPLSISTDFAFRSQDAVGWNPRRFRFATSAEAFRKLSDAYGPFDRVGADPAPALQAELARQIAQTAGGTLTILDARLAPGTADQSNMAATVAAHFTTTAHTLAEEPGGGTSALGRILWLRFRLEMELPAGFRASPEMRIVPRVCGRP